jgi:DNA/RNA-binding domain of Phe-tRNA-synthetase-like protein
MAEQVLVATERWRREHPGARASAVLYLDCAGTAETAEFADMKRSLEAELRERWSAADKQTMLSDPTLAAYERHDRKFGQNYHVTMQIRSIAQKGKAIPDRNPIIEAMFMTELRTGVLAAAQDCAALQIPIVVDSTDGTEIYQRYDGVEERCKTGDQVMLDSAGKVLTSIAQGPTSHGLVTSDSKSIAYCFYFPVGVTDGVIEEALQYLDTCVPAACPAARKFDQVTVSAD